MSYNTFLQLPNNNDFICAQAIVTSTISSMTVQTLSRAKEVCKAWQTAFDENPVCQKLMSFRILHSNMFGQFLMDINQIDLTSTTKYENYYYRSGNRRPKTGQKEIPQQKYESVLLSHAISNAIKKYNVLFKAPRNLNLTPEEKQSLLVAADTLWKDFYPGGVPISKVINIDVDVNVEFAQNPDWAANTVAIEYLEKLEKTSYSFRHMKHLTQ